jgi:hypothetical protein
MRLTRLVPEFLKAPIRRQIRRVDIRNALLLLRDGVTDARLHEFHKAWGNEGFSADETYLGQVIKFMAGPVLECGTGGTTLLCDVRGMETYSLEQDKEWAADTLAFIKHAKVIDAPLKDYGGYYWYDVREDLPKHFGLVICDGPYVDKGLGEPYYSAWRYGILPWLKATGRTFEVLLLDDAHHPSAPTILKRWEDEFGVEVERINAADGEMAIVVPSNSRNQL